jgi:signal transduction histidine kinase
VLAERVDALEDEVADLRRLVGDAVEEARRAIGRLDRAADYCRRLAQKLEELEAWRSEHDGTVRQVTSSIRLAGGALLSTPRRGRGGGRT